MKRAAIGTEMRLELRFFQDQRLESRRQTLTATTYSFKTLISEIHECQV